MKKKIISYILALIILISLIITISLLFKKKEDQTPLENESFMKNEVAKENINHDKDNSTYVPELHEPQEQTEKPKKNNILPNSNAQSIDAFKGYRLATNDDKNNYQITNLKKSTNSKFTTITGKVKNNGGIENFILKAKFKGEKSSSSSVEIKGLKLGQEKVFELKFLNSVTTDDYEVYIEYVGE